MTPNNEHMDHTQTIDAPRVSVTVEEPSDELTQAELERLIVTARKVKRRQCGHGTIDLNAVTGQLWIKGWRPA